MSAGVTWTLVGLTLDLVGGFLLSAEAIGLKNLQALRNRLSGAEGKLHWPIYRERTPDGNEVIWTPRTPSWFGVHATGALVLIALLAPLLYRPVGARANDFYGWLSEQPIWSVILVSLAALYFGWVLFFALAELAVHVIVGGTLKLGARLLTWTHSHAKDGLAGSVGFGFLSAGFVLQGLGAVL
jgi:hypothetical protein